MSELQTAYPATVGTNRVLVIPDEWGAGDVSLCEPPCGSTPGFVRSSIVLVDCDEVIARLRSL